MRDPEFEHEFDRVYAKYFGEVYKFVLTLCRDPDLAEELTQETFFKALKNIGGFRGNCRIGSWLCQIAKNTYYDWAKKHNREVELLPESWMVAEDAGQGCNAGNIEEGLLEKEAAFAIHRAVHYLREPYKEVFWLRTFGELSFVQIGALFDKSESWARVTYYRARVMVREAIE